MMKSHDDTLIEFIANIDYNNFRIGIDDDLKSRGNKCRYCTKPAERGRHYCSARCKKNMKIARRALRNAKRCGKCEIILGMPSAGWGDGENCTRCIERTIEDLLRTKDNIRLEYE